MVIDRLVIPASPAGTEPLANGTGLYVHHPARAGRGYYAVTVAVNGRENTWTFGAGQTAGPVEEVKGPGKPVFQRQMDMKVLFDYPGRRLQYVQWTAPPLSNLPDQYYNWSVFIPEAVKLPAPLELVLTGNGMFRRPRWPHRLDTILLSPQDRGPQAPGAASGDPVPFDTFYFGYPQSHGTLGSLRQGSIQPYTWRRMLAFVDWAVKDLKVNRSQTTPSIDPAFIVCSGDRGYSATAALQFGMRHPEVFSLVYTCKGMPDPSAIPPMAKLAGWHPRPSKTEVWHLQQLVGRKEWGLKTDADGEQDVWEFFNLTKLVAATPQVVRPMLSYGGRGGWDWPPVARFLAALAAARQPVVSEGTWGAVDPPGLKNPGRAGTSGLNVHRDRPIPVFANHSGDYQGGRNGDGGQTNYGVWWDNLEIVDRPDRLEITIVGGGT
ncbi:MAG: hypothetical protein AMJ81_10430, partial [Phycisphaerae bacterium SM23_33]